MTQFPTSTPEPANQPILSVFHGGWRYDASNLTSYPHEKPLTEAERRVLERIGYRVKVFVPSAGGQEQHIYLNYWDPKKRYEVLPLAFNPTIQADCSLTQHIQEGGATDAVSPSGVALIDDGKPVMAKDVIQHLIGVTGGTTISILAWIYIQELRTAYRANR